MQKPDHRLPHNKKEGLLYGFIIALITATLMATLNTIFAVGYFNWDIALSVLKLLPILIVIVMLIEEFAVSKIVAKLLAKFVGQSDGFNARILFNIVFCVTLMSAIMTIVGGILAAGPSLDVFTSFPEHWPRNFFIAFWCEVLLAQPIARFAMKKLHATAGTTAQEPISPIPDVTSHS